MVSACMLGCDLSRPSAACPQAKHHALLAFASSRTTKDGACCALAQSPFLLSPACSQGSVMSSRIRRHSTTWHTRWDHASSTAEHVLAVIHSQTQSHSTLLPHASTLNDVAQFWGMCSSLTLCSAVKKAGLPAVSSEGRIGWQEGPIFAHDVGCRASNLLPPTKLHTPLPAAIHLPLTPPPYRSPQPPACTTLLATAVSSRLRTMTCAW
jgi:hypothetical protein